MSLKAKLEAVIYAAEEPVSLAQLAALFAGEAMEWKAKQEAARAAEPAEPEPPAEAVAETLPLIEETPAGEVEPAASPETAEPDTTEPEAAKPETETSETLPQPFAEASAEASPEADGAETEGDSAAAGDRAEENSEGNAAAEVRRLARRRDREVKAVLRGLLDELIATYATDGRGIEIREIAGGYRMATKPECHDVVRSFVKSLKPPFKLSMPALETLAVIAYKQPVTAPEVNEIRGVDSSGVFGSLLARKLITTAGRKPVIGRPILYKTTREFLLRFGLKDVSELPSMEEFEKMAALEFEEAEPAADAETNGTAEENLTLDLNTDAAEEAADQPEAQQAESEPNSHE